MFDDLRFHLAAIIGRATRTARAGVVADDLGRPPSMRSHCCGQTDIDFSYVIANDIEDPARQSIIKQFAESLITYARVMLAHGAKQLFARRGEDDWCCDGHSTPVSPEEAEKIKTALELWGCSGGKM